MIKLKSTLLTVIIISCAALTAAQDVKWYDNINVNAFISGGYSYNFNKPASEKNDYRIFDFDDNQFKLDVFELSLKKDAIIKGTAGFRFDLTAGSSLPRVTRSSGLNSGDIDIQQAYLTYLIPLGSGIKLDFGKFATPFGYELMEGYDGYNDNYTRSFQFGYSIPFTHTGFRAVYNITPEYGVTVIAVNGWDNAVENNKSKSVGVQFYLNPVKDLNIYAGAIMGPESNDNNSNNRSMADFIATYAVCERLTAAVNYEYGVEESAYGPDIDTDWDSFSGYLKFNVTNKFSLALRGELFNDADGYRTGTIQKLKEVTLTPSLKLNDNFTVRADLRYDMSDVKVFTDKDNQLKDNQFTFAINLIAVF